MSANTKIAKNTLMLYFRMLFNMGVTFYTSRIILHTLGVEDYGIYNVVGGVIILFSFLNISMSSATQRFLTFELGRNAGLERMKKIFSTSLNIHIFISLLILLIGETIGLYFLNSYMLIPDSKMFAANWVYQCSLFASCIGIVALPYMAIIISYERMSVFACISILDTLLKLLVAYALYTIPSDRLIVYSVLMFSVSIIQIAIYIIYCRRNFLESKYRYIRDKALLRNMFSFAGWNMIGNLSYIGFTQGINVLLNVFFGPSINAARGIAVQLQGGVNQLARNFQMAVNPQITKDYAAGNLSEMYTLVFRSSRFSFFLVFILALPLILQTEKVLMWWLGEIPDYTIIFFKIIICISLIDTLANPLNTCAMATGKIKYYQIVEGGILLMIVPASYVLLKIIVVPYVAFGVHFFIALLTQVVRLFLLKKMVYISLSDYFRFVVLRILLVLVLILSILYTLNFLMPTIMGQFFACTFIAITISGIVIFRIGLIAEERNFIIGKLKHLYRKQ